MSSNLPKLFIPGPINVSPETFAAMSQPMIGHRGKDFQEIYAATQPVLKQLIGTSRPVWLSTSSAWGVMEGAIRNLVGKKVLNCCCGAFSDKWYDVSLRCGKQAQKLQVEWGKPILPEQLRAALSEGNYDAVTLIHNETSTGVMNPLKELAAVVNEFPDVLLIVDTVSSLSAVPIEMDAWGIDVVLAGVQKALAVPPGLSLLAVSQRAMERAKTIEGRGYYFDFVEFEQNADKDMTPSTPAIPQIRGLLYQLQQIQAEGLSARFARHADLNQMTADWAKRHGFGFFAPEGYRSISLTCIAASESFDVAKMVKDLKEKHGFLIDGGYGKLKGKTFRISNMGNETRETMQELFTALDAVLAQ